VIAGSTGSAPVGLFLKGDKMSEISWPSEPLEARIKGGYLHFYAPDGERAVVKLDTVFVNLGNDDVWHAEFTEDKKFIKVTPSIHYVDHWHSPNPVVFKLVDELKDPKK
jgi:hypothetical protein